MIDWQKKVLAPNVKVFGEPAFFTPSGGSGYGVNVIFDNAYKEVTVSEYGTDIVSVFPAVGINLAEFSATPMQGDSLFIPRINSTYSVRNAKPDSHGGMFLVLNKI